MATQACSCEREIDTPFVPSFSMAMLLLLPTTAAAQVLVTGFGDSITDLDFDAFPSSTPLALALQRQRSEWHKKNLHGSIRPERVHGFATDLYRCDGCGCKQTRVHRVIRPGRAIDRARTYATCCECNARWEV